MDMSFRLFPHTITRVLQLNCCFNFGEILNLAQFYSGNTLDTIVALVLTIFFPIFVHSFSMMLLYFLQIFLLLLRPGIEALLLKIDPKHRNDAK